MKSKNSKSLLFVAFMAILFVFPTIASAQWWSLSMTGSTEASSTAVLTWNRPYGMVPYVHDIYVESFGYVARISGGVTTWRASGLTPGKKYRFLVVAQYFWGYYAMSNMVELTMPAPYDKPIDGFPNTGNYRTFGRPYDHVGSDFPSPAGTEVRSMRAGRVVWVNATSSGGGGWDAKGKPLPGGMVIIQHLDKFGGSFYAVYGHLTPSVKIGDQVRQGSRIGALNKVYYYSNSDKDRVDHLHLGVFVGRDPPITEWGYRSNPSGWIDPLVFVRTKL
jgi:hypothetical protein